MFKHQLTSAALSILVIFSATAYADSATQATFKIGVSAPLSGEIAEYGAAVRNGIELAIQQEPTEFKSIKFIYEDNRYDSSIALDVYRKLTTIDGVSAIYQWGESPLKSVAALAERNHTPLLAMSIDATPALGAHYIIRSINHPRQIAEKLLQYLRSHKFKRIGIVATEDPFISALVTALEEQADQSESIDVINTFQPSETDFRAQIVRMREAHYDALGVYLLPGQVSAFYRQSKALHFSIPSFGTDVFESKTENQQANGAMEGAIFPNIEVPKLFVDAYTEKYGNNNQISYAYNAYLFAKQSSYVFDGHTALTPEEIVQRYAQNDRAGAYNFQESKEFGRFFEYPFVIKQITKGEFVALR